LPGWRTGQGDRTGRDRTRADFTWCMRAIDWGWGVEETAERLMELSAKLNHFWTLCASNWGEDWSHPKARFEAW
jgi:hypothetical protein